MIPSIFKVLTRVILGNRGGGSTWCRARKMIISLDLELFKVRLLAEAQVEIKAVQMEYHELERSQ